MVDGVRRRPVPAIAVAGRLIFLGGQVKTGRSGVLRTGNPVVIARAKAKARARAKAGQAVAAAAAAAAMTADLRGIPTRL